MIKERSDCEAAVTKHGLPADYAGTIERYIFDRIPPGSFVEMVMRNDLIQAAASADHLNQRLLFEWASFMYNEMPRQMWGSAEAFSLHLSSVDPED